MQFETRCPPVTIQKAELFVTTFWIFLRELSAC